MSEYKKLEERYNKVKETHDEERIVSTFACPICGARLKGRVIGPFGDTADVQGVIECKGCGLLYVQSRGHSLYEKGNPERDALKEAKEKIRPYVKYTYEPID